MGRFSSVSEGPGGAGPAAASGGDGFEAAHAVVAADPSLQFEVAAVPPPPPLPDWLAAVFTFLGELAPAFLVIFWIGVAAIVLLILWFIGREILGVRLPDRHKPSAPSGEGDWRPAAGVALALLSDADALAEQGHYDEAVHLILLRSIGDIDGRLPNTVRPALTARDIAGLQRLPATARPAFARIARVVEASLFGGRAVDRADFTECRQAYEAFAFPGAWAA
ncbi:MAG: DUF4129 domain-containing protein [Brevundimonas sp.]|nr:DUF4129 domain-containing protein [Brevundimonas sp.]